MWHRLCLLLLFPLLLAAFQSDESDAGVLILKDGRRVSIHGSIDVKGRSVQFRDDDGNLISIATDKVDLEASQAELNKKLNQYNKSSQKEDNSLYGIAEKMKAAREEGKSVSYDAFIEEDLGRGRKQSSWDGLDKAPLEKQAIELFNKIKARLNSQPNHSYVTIFFVLVGLICLAGLASFCCQMYLIREAFAFGLAGWGWGLALTFWLPRILSWVSAFSALTQKPGLEMPLTLVGIALSLLYFVLHIVFIMVHMTGSRLKMFAIIYSPLIMGMILVGFFLYVGIKY